MNLTDKQSRARPLATMIGEGRVFIPRHSTFESIYKAAIENEESRLRSELAAMYSPWLFEALHNPRAACDRNSVYAARFTDYHGRPCRACVLERRAHDPGDEDPRSR